MSKGGRRSTSFRPGVSGNPDGRPKRPEEIEARRVVADVKAAARELSPEAMDTLKNAMVDPRAPWNAKIARDAVAEIFGVDHPARIVGNGGRLAAPRDENGSRQNRRGGAQGGGG